MNFPSVVVLLIVIAVAGLALRSIIKDHKNGHGCDGNCAGCGGACNISTEELEKIKIEK